MRVVRWILALLAAALVTEVLAAAASTQFVLGSLAALGVDVTIPDRLRATVHDVFGMLPAYAPIIVAGFLVAMPVAAFIARRTGIARTTLFPAAGAVAMLAALLIMKASFEIMPIAGARTTAGLAAQMMAGAVGGYLFARLTGGRDRSRPSREPRSS